jgi:hypothetical protein
MISADDLFEPVDRLYAWLPATLDWLPPAVRNQVVVPIVILVLLVTPRIVVHRLLPWLGRFVLVPLVAVAAGAVTAVAFLVDLAFTEVFRVFSLPLLGVHYAIGDVAIAGSRGVRRGTRFRTGQLGGWLRDVSPGLLLLAGVVLVVLWGRGYCDREPAAGCAEPVSQWWAAFRAILPDWKAPWA